MADLDIATLRKLHGEAVANKHDYFEVDPDEAFRIAFMAAAPALLDAAEERDRLREMAGVFGKVATVELTEAKAETNHIRAERDALRAQRDGLLAAAEAFCAALNARAGKSLGEKRPPISTVIHAGEALNAAIRAAKGQP